MKTTKKIFATVLAVMMIALMIPFSASATKAIQLRTNLQLMQMTLTKSVITHSASSRLQTSTLQQVSTHVLSPTKHLRML